MIPGQWLRFCPQGLRCWLRRSSSTVMENFSPAEKPAGNSKHQIAFLGPLKTTKFPEDGGLQGSHTERTLEGDGGSFTEKRLIHLGIMGVASMWSESTELTSWATATGLSQALDSLPGLEHSPPGVWLILQHMWNGETDPFLDYCWEIGTTWHQADGLASVMHVIAMKSSYVMIPGILSRPSLILLKLRSETGTLGRANWMCADVNEVSMSWRSTVIPRCSSASELVKPCTHCILTRKTRFSPQVLLRPRPTC